MKGVQFLIDEHGNPKSIVLDIEEWGELWAFFRDGMLAEPARGAAAAAPPSPAKAADGDAATAAGSDGAQDAQRGQADIEREYAQAARRAVDRSFPTSRRATDWDDGAFERELAKITDEDRREMQAIADEGLEEDLKHWPEYDAVNGAAADPSTGPSFADRMEALCEQPPSQVRAVAMLRLLSHATPADKAELLQRALAQMTDEDRREMQEFAEEGLEEDLKHWPEY